MSEKVGIFRTRKEMDEALEKLVEVKERYRHIGISSPARHMNSELINALELGYMPGSGPYDHRGGHPKGRKAGVDISAWTSTPGTTRTG